MDDKELIWVEKEFAEKYKEIEKDVSKRAERIALFEEYIKTVKDGSRNEFRVNLESLEEDAAMYAGLMLHVKQTFEKAKKEQLEASNAIWEKFEKEIPSIHEKTGKIIAELDPLEQKLKKIDELFGKINTYNMDKVLETVEKIANLYGTQKDMVQFLLDNFGKDPE